MTSLKITVLLATYNGEAYIKEQLDSILNQSFEDYKVVIRDDCSSDKTFEILEEYKNAHKEKIEIFRNTSQLGVVSNFEKLIQDSHSNYLALCDQDDIWDKDKLLKNIAALEKLEDQDKPFLIHSDLEMIDSKNETINNSFFNMRHYKFPRSRSIDIMLGRCGVMGNTIFFNQVLKEKILPFPKNLVMHDYWIALINEFFGQRITLNEALVKYRIHHSNVSNSFEKVLKNKFIKPKNRAVSLPYHGIEREKVLKEFLSRFSLKEEDKVIVNHFINYLVFNKSSKIYLISLVFRYNFFRQSIVYRLKLVGGILWKKQL